jgi:hypothetical protein
MKSPTDDLAERAKARAAQFAAEKLDPWTLEQVRRDTEVAHKWLAKQQAS